MKNWGVIRDPYAVVTYFYIVLLFGCFYSSFAAYGPYYQTGFLSGFLVGIVMLIPFLLLGFALAFVARASPNASFRLLRSWTFWILAASLLLLVLGVETPDTEGNSMGDGRSLTLSFALWFGGISFGLLTLKWFHRKFSESK